MNEFFIPLEDLALIGDRRTCAILNKKGNIIWYCPQRFDNPSLFAGLLDPEKGGSWKLNIEGLEFDSRNYVEDSAMLQTTLIGDKGSLLLEDWMPLNTRFYGICRKLSASPVPYTMQIDPRPNYARRSPVLEKERDNHATIEFDFHLQASHSLELKSDSINCHVPADEEAWFILSEKALDQPVQILEEVRKLTLKTGGKSVAISPIKDHMRRKCENRFVCFACLHTAKTEA